MKSLLPHAVILGLSPTGLYVARELGRLGVPLLGVEAEFSCASLSRYFRQGEGVWRESDSASLLQRLIHFAEKQPTKPVLIPTSDIYIELIIDNHKRLTEWFHVAQCYENEAGLLLDKLKFHKLCIQYDIATPGIWSLSDSSQIDSIIDDIPLPCILKPSLIHLARPYLHGRKVLVAQSKSELISLSKELPSESGHWMVQEIIPGEESRITLVAGYAGKEESAADTFTARKLRQYPPGFGSASRAISENCEESRQLTLSLITQMGFKGIYGSEFKRDPRDGKLKLIEINPRPTLWFYLSHAAGKRLVEREYYDLVGLPIPDTKAQYDGIVWQYTLKDCASALFYKIRGGQFVFPPPDLSTAGETKGRCWPVFSMTDPLPFLAELYVYASKFLRRVF